MRKTLLVILVLPLALMVVAACGGGGDSGGGGGDADVQAGQKLFAKAVLGSQAGCSTCHSLDGSVVVGPSMQGVGSRLSADEIRTSILDPDAVLAEGFTAGLMPPVWSDKLTDEQVNQLVAYLSSLK
ncbi:MAG TPA: cytochrome c [Caldilineae bacterium]|nr:cytochrome c [Caldilineae bacterium]